uniref:Putative corticosteroid 11-beta-dehydrogenase n=1 Tax=Ixodes scapularis TaxID=6945 RepID=A0A4D5RQ12_IXOSC
MCMCTTLLLFALLAAASGAVRYYVPALSLLAEAFGTIVLVRWGCQKSAAFIRRRLIGRILDSAGKAVLITGCDTGFGNLLTRKLATKGYHVYAGCLFSNGGGAQELASISNVTVLQLNVTKQDEIDAAYEAIKRSLGHNVLWAVVSNAGTLNVGFIEWQSTKTIRTDFEVSVLGAVNVSKKFMPLLKKSRGRLLFVSSIAAHFTGPGSVVYSMCKHAISSLAEGLRRECQRYGVQVCSIEPAGYRTALNDPSVLLERMTADLKNVPQEALSSFSAHDYSVFMVSLDWALNMTLSEKIDHVINTMALSIEESHPRAVYSVGSVKDQIVVKIMQTLPTEWLDAMFALQWKLIELRMSIYK